jgi:hypothetical protein
VVTGRLVVVTGAGAVVVGTGGWTVGVTGIGAVVVTPPAGAGAGVAPGADAVVVVGTEVAAEEPGCSRATVTPMKAVTPPASTTDPTVRRRIRARARARAAGVNGRRPAGLDTRGPYPDNLNTT